MVANLRLALSEFCEVTHHLGEIDARDQRAVDPIRNFVSPGFVENEGQDRGGVEDASLIPERLPLADRPKKRRR